MGEAPSSPENVETCGNIMSVFPRMTEGGNLRGREEAMGSHRVLFCPERERAG